MVPRWLLKRSMACGGGGDALPLWWPTSFSYMVDSLVLVVMGCALPFFFTLDECQCGAPKGGMGGIQI